MTTGKAIIGQSGGPTAVINQSLAGFIRSAVGNFDEVLGAKHGIKGMLSGDYVDLSKLSDSEIHGISKTPASALGSVRKKPNEEEIDKLLDTFKKEDIRNFFYIGGNDSAETAHLILEGAKSIDFEMRVFHIPKTIDNDLLETDHTPGYGSAARFVAHAFQGDDSDNRSLGGIKINILMGRHAGWLTAASVLGKSNKDDGPHLIYLPERVFDTELFEKDVLSVYKSLGRCVVAVSEGIQNEKGEHFSQIFARDSATEIAGEKDSHGNIQLSGSGVLGDKLASIVSRNLEGIRVRADTFGYLQRSFIADVSEVDSREAERVGAYSVEVCLKNNKESGSIVLKRRDAEEYYSDVDCVELIKVAKGTKNMPDNYLSADKPYVTNEFFEYAMPLTGGIEPKTQLFV